MYNLKSMSDDELRKLIDAAKREEYDRKRVGREKAWRNLADALNEYVKWNDIEVNDFNKKIYISAGSFTTKDMGIIKLDY